MIDLNFSQKKFLKLPLRKQHKKCAEELRRTYDKIAKKEDINHSLDQYNMFLSWMGSDPLKEHDFKSIADRYHEHLDKAGVNLRENNLLPRITTKDREASAPLLPIAIYLDGVRSAFNVGSILRTVEAFALGTVYFHERTPFIDNRQVQNTSMDCYRQLPCYQNVPLESLPKPIIALETSPDGVSIHDFIFPDIFTLVLGNEEYGCSETALKKANYVVQIPLRGRKNSLNVANAFAIAAAEIARQKTPLEDSYEE